MNDDKKVSFQEVFDHLSSWLLQLEHQHIELSAAFREVAPLVLGEIVAGDILSAERIAAHFEKRAAVTTAELGRMGLSFDKPNRHLMSLANAMRGITLPPPPYLSVIPGGKADQD